MSRNTERVVIVSGAETEQDALRSAIRSSSREVVCVESIERALELAIRLGPELLILDLDADPVAGMNACRELQQHPSTRSAKVLLLRNDASGEDVVIGLEAGAADVISKPYDARVLRARVETALRTKRRESDLEEQSLTDGLTGLYNRMYFDRRLEAELRASRRSGRAISVILVDVDKFKSINDRFGHPAGDTVLKDLADVLVTCIRRVDVAARYGGEEFALLLMDAPLEDALRCSARVHSAVAQRDFLLSKENVSITGSFGVASTEDTAELPTPTQLVERADLALYEAKNAGRDTIRVSRPDGSIVAPEEV